MFPLLFSGRAVYTGLFQRGRGGWFQSLLTSLLLQREFVFQEAENPKIVRESLTISYLGEAYLQLPKPPTVLLAFSWSSFSDQTDLGLLLIFSP